MRFFFPTKTTFPLRHDRPIQKSTFAVRRYVYLYKISLVNCKRFILIEKVDIVITSILRHARVTGFVINDIVVTNLDNGFTQIMSTDEYMWEFVENL